MGSFHFGKKTGHQVVSCSPRVPLIFAGTPSRFLFLISSTTFFFLGAFLGTPAGMSFRELRNFCEMMRSLGYHRLVSMASRRSQGSWGRRFIWATKKQPGWLGYIGDEKQASYVGTRNKTTQGSLLTNQDFMVHVSCTLGATVLQTPPRKAAPGSQKKIEKSCAFWRGYQLRVWWFRRWFGFKRVLFSPRSLGKWSNLSIFFNWIGSTTT